MKRAAQSRAARWIEPPGCGGDAPRYTDRPVSDQRDQRDQREQSTTQAGQARRRAYLDELRHILPPSPPWDAWLEASGELPPDFDALPSCASLPDPLPAGAAGAAEAPSAPGTAGTASGEGSSLSPTEWETRRSELKALFQQWVLGSVPPAPGRLAAEVLAERSEAGVAVRQVKLVFGPGGAASLRLELLIPEDNRAADAGTSSRPVFMTQHTHRGWALVAVRRGYIGCVYAGADSLDDTDTFVKAYPQYDWSRITRRAWAASRCIDYLAEYVPQADVARIVLTGHSRNGKLSLIATALDERIAAVISSSSGAGGSMPFRDYGEHHFGESVELLTRAFPDWFHPRLRFFSGREHKLPVDLHQLVALCAPRPCLLSCALNDSVESAWALQQTYLSAGRVYAALGAAGRLGILWRPGGHETWTTVIEQYLDWCDAQLWHGAAPAPATNTDDVEYRRLILPVDWDAWRRASGERIDPQRLPAFADTAAAVRWLLGEAPPAGPPPEPGLASRYGAEAPHIAALLGRAVPGEGLEKHPLAFGEYLAGDVFAPSGTADSGQRVPGVLWLHPRSVPRGYIAGYMRGEQPVRTLARAGFAVLGFDQIGHGRRIEEAEGFYRRHPRWSLLGKMLRDSAGALAALRALPFVDPAQVWVVGYSLGALVGLHLCALDSRPAGLAAVCLPPPFRTDTDVAETGGFQRWGRRSLLLPRLGFFEGQAARIPYDLDDLLGALAPRPTLVVSPTLDREAPLERVTQMVERARAAFTAQGAGARLAQMAPVDYNRFVPHMQELVATWLREQALAGSASGNAGLREAP